MQQVSFYECAIPETHEKYILKRRYRTMKKKFLAKVTILGATICMLGSLAAKAAVVTPLYSFTADVKTHKANTVIGAQYRASSNTGHPWCVELKKTTDKKNKKTVFWVETPAGLNLCEDKVAVAGEGVFRQTFSKRIGNSYIRLVAEDDDYWCDTYHIEGAWAEE